MADWFVNLNWDHNVDIWMNCRRNGRAAIGWWDGSEKELADNTSYQKAIAHFREIKPTDRVVAFLKNRRLGGWGTVLKGHDPKIWDPQLHPGKDGGDFGRVVQVRWEEDGTPPIGKGSVMKRDEMYGFDFRPTISSLRAESFERLKAIIQDSARWEPLYELASADDDAAEPQAEREDETPSPLREAALRNILARNLSLIESGLQPFDSANGPEEVSVGEAGRIDLLCKDRDGNPVVIELKRDRSSDEVVGQLARYVGYVKKHFLKPGKRVRGIVVTHEADERLLLAIEAFENVELRLYDVKVTLRKPADSA